MQDIEEMQRKYRAMEAVFTKHVPVRLWLTFQFVRPKSAKNRPLMVVKPDLDKLVRGVCDALTGVIYHDDAQVVEIIASKRYGAVESVTVRAEEVV
jgi:Holliday junction resolvase RusA-like endonuclease